MVGIIFQSWFILFISLLLYFNDSRVKLVTELTLFTFISTSIFLFWQRKKLKELESYFFIISSLSLILYTSLIGMILLPDDLFQKQEHYLKLRIHKIFFGVQGIVVKLQLAPKEQ